MQQNEKEFLLIRSIWPLLRMESCYSILIYPFDYLRTVFPYLSMMLTFFLIMIDGCPLGLSFLIYMNTIMKKRSGENKICHEVDCWILYLSPFCNMSRQKLPNELLYRNTQIQTHTITSWKSNMQCYTDFLKEKMVWHTFDWNCNVDVVK